MTIARAQWLTLGVVLGGTCLVLALDLLIIRLAGPDASISRVLSHLFGRWPTVAVAVVFWLGLLVGHVWLPAE